VTTGSGRAKGEEIADRLQAIADEIADLAIDELRTAVRRGERNRPSAERSLTQARRAVEKAVHLLRRLDDDPDGVQDETSA